MTTTTYKSVPQIILEQLGGNQFLAMTGSKYPTAVDDYTLRLKLARNKSKANYLYVHLNGDDTYTMRFIKYVEGGYKVNHKKQTCKYVETQTIEVKTYEHIYFDQLQELFTETTEMYTRLF